MTRRSTGAFQDTVRCRFKFLYVFLATLNVAAKPFSLVKSPPLTLVIRFGSLAGDLRFFGCLPAQWFSFRSAMSFRFSGRAFNGSSPQIECGGGVRFRTLCVVALQPIQSSCTIILLCAFSCPDGCSEFPFCLSLVKDPLSLANLCSELRRGLAGDVRLEVFFWVARLLYGSWFDLQCPSLSLVSGHRSTSVVNGPGPQTECGETKRGQQVHFRISCITQ
jgi:hypothetical protein